MRTEYMGSQTDHYHSAWEVSIDGEEDHVGDFFTKYGQVEEVSSVKNKFPQFFVYLVWISKNAKM